MTWGDKVKYVGDVNGEDDPCNKEGLLKKNTVYTIIDMDIFPWWIDIVLEEFPKRKFNSASFVCLGI